eukprot:scaffold679354_cov47-Prasinocladus_malaysianus.AAC.1
MNRIKRSCDVTPSDVVRLHSILWMGAASIQQTGLWERYSVAAGFSVYGPRTVIVLSTPRDDALVVEEYTLAGNDWVCSDTKLNIPESNKVFAPANMRAAAENAEYERLIAKWMAEKYTLRYSGGLVPDVYHIFAKVRH